MILCAATSAVADVFGSRDSLSGVSFCLLIESLESGNNEGFWGLTRSALETRAMSTILRHGIRCLPCRQTDDTGYLYVRFVSMASSQASAGNSSTPIMIRVSFHQDLIRAGNASWRGSADTWSTLRLGLFGEETYRSLALETVEEMVEAFSVDYILANVSEADRDGRLLPQEAQAVKDGVRWEETPTHRTKIKYANGVEVGRWAFPKSEAP